MSRGMNECEHKENPGKCPFNDPEYRGDLGECQWLTHLILNGPICTNPWHGETAESVKKIKEGGK